MPNDSIIPAKGKITVTVCDVKIDTNKIKACVDVDHTEQYKKIGLNNNRKNDILCKNFEATQDMGMAQKMNLKNTSGVEQLTVGGKHTIVVYPKHVVGEAVVGLDPTLNPKATVDLNIVDLVTGQTIYKGTQKATKELEPKKMVPVEFSNISINSTNIKVCATVNKVHEEKGFNLNNGNDTYCQEFSVTRNYAMKSLKASPSLVYGTGAVQKHIAFTYTVSNEAAKSNLSPAPLIVIRQNGKAIWSKNITIADGDTVTLTQELLVTLSGNDQFEVEVNQDRKIIEYKPSGNPYADNTKGASVTVQQLGCAECTAKNTSNKWDTTFNVSITKGEKYSYKTCASYGTNKDGSSYCRRKERRTGCRNTSHKSDSKTISFSESYKIKNVLYRSKYTKDKDLKGDGWVDLLSNSGAGKIKAGYGFEMAVLVEYKTDRFSKYENYRKSFSPVPPFHKDMCNYGSISPTVTTATQPDKLRVKFPFLSGNNVFELVPTQKSGQWYNSAYVFELPLRKSLTGNSNVRQIYTNERAKVGTKNIEIITPLWMGYPEGDKKKLQDCKTVKMTILSNDDLHGHLTVG